MPTMVQSEREIDRAEAQQTQYFYDGTSRLTLDQFQSKYPPAQYPQYYGGSGAPIQYFTSSNQGATAFDQQQPTYTAQTETAPLPNMTLDAYQKNDFRVKSGFDLPLEIINGQYATPEMLDYLRSNSGNLTQRMGMAGATREKPNNWSNDTLSDVVRVAAPIIVGAATGGTFAPALGAATGVGTTAAGTLAGAGSGVVGTALTGGNSEDYLQNTLLGAGGGALGGASMVGSPAEANAITASQYAAAGSPNAAYVGMGATEQALTGAALTGTPWLTPASATTEWAAATGSPIPVGVPGIDPTVPNPITPTPGSAPGAPGAPGGTIPAGDIISGLSPDDLSQILNAIGTLGGIWATAEGSQALADAARYSADLQNAQYQQTRTDLEPWRQIGVDALGRLSGLYNFDGTSDGQTSEQWLGMDPGYQFRLQEGEKALARQQAAGGSRFSGNALKAAGEYSQNFASNEFNNAFNRLSGLAGTGQVATVQTGQFGANAANNIGNAAMSAADARASGYVGMANTLNRGIGQGYGIANPTYRNPYAPRNSLNYGY